MFEEKFSEIFPNIDVKGKVVIAKLTDNKENKPTCVLGILSNDIGLKISKEMLSWLIHNYNVYVVIQQFPGLLYEYPALRFAQWLLETEQIKYLLYCHTKGAARPFVQQTWVRNMWKNEFVDNKDNYIKIVDVDTPSIACPFSSNEKHTWFNGFFVNKAAMNEHGLITTNKDRYVYEKLFSDDKNVKIVGLVQQEITANQVMRYICKYRR